MSQLAVSQLAETVLLRQSVRSKPGNALQLRSIPGWSAESCLIRTQVCTVTAAPAVYAISRASKSAAKRMKRASKAKDGELRDELTRYKAQVQALTAQLEEQQKQHAAWIKKHDNAKGE